MNWNADPRFFLSYEEVLTWRRSRINFLMTKRKGERGLSDIKKAPLWTIQLGRGFILNDS
jgi:hypothetical protein